MNFIFLLERSKIRKSGKSTKKGIPVKVIYDHVPHSNVLGIHLINHNRPKTVFNEKVFNLNIIGLSYESVNNELLPLIYNAQPIMPLKIQRLYRIFLVKFS